MRRSLPIVFCLGMTLSTVASASLWNDLWQTREQQAAQLLKDGHAKQAAEIFHDPHRRAYAQNQAKEYAKAAATLAPMHDADALFNRGNALARNGQLKEALSAYDAALKQTPQAKDIQHNRDLVKKALQQQQQTKQQPKQSGQKKNQSQNKQQNGDKQSGSSAPNDQQSSPKADQSSSSSQSQNGHSANHSENSKPQPNQNSGAQSSPSQNKIQPQQGKTSPSQKASPTPSQSQSHPSAQDDEKLAAQDTHAAEQQSAPAQKKQIGLKPQGTQSSPMASAHAPQPRSEQDISQEQWLRRIPDDPGGLLRRKFMIEHMLKQQENRQ